MTGVSGHCVDNSPKTKFIALLTGEGEGCDYTIGCNINWNIFEARTLGEALETVQKIFNDYTNDDEGLDNIELYEIAGEIPINMKIFEKEYVSLKQTETAREIEQTEKAQLQLLKSKYEGEDV